MLVITWMLWNALRYPQWKHPIFRYIQQQKTKAKPFAWYWRLLLLVLVLVIAAFVALFPLPALLSVLAFAVGIPAFALVFNGTILGLYWVGAIAEALARENRHGRFDLLSLTPDGSFGVSWRLAVAVINRHDWLNTIYRLIKGVVLGTLVVLAFAVFMLIMGAFFAEISPQRENQIRILFDVLMIGLAVIFFWADHIQSILIALLIGLLLPQFQRDEGLLKLLAPIGFLVMQCLIYLFGLSLYLGLTEILRTVWSETYLWSFFLLLSCLLLFCSIRDFVIRGLWRFYLHVSQSAEEAQIVHA
jgi:hypothetical protein